MKKRFFFSTFLTILFTTTLLSQTEPTCGTSGETNPLVDQCVYSQSVDPVINENADVRVYNIFFWGIRHTNGNGNTGFNEQKVLTAVANLNIAFNQYKIFFKYYGMDFIDDSSIYNPPGMAEIMSVVNANSDYVKSNAFDVTNIVSVIQPTETNYQSIFHPNHSAIKIVEVDNALGTPLVERCYDNYVTPPVIGGSVTKFNDDVINTNITVTPQDSIGINSPTLIDDLQQGLYKIEKNRIDGSTEQTVIYKGNN